MDLEQNGTEYDTLGCSVLAVYGGNAIMLHNAWSRGVRCDHAPLCFGDTASRYFRPVGPLKHTDETCKLIYLRF